MAETYKLLLARSGNECAFPDCTHPIFNDEGLYIAQLCHIKSANKGGQRYDGSQTDDERRAFENLLFLCYRHHKETDDVEKFPVDVLIEMKRQHEAKFTEQGRKITQEMLQQIESESQSFWNLQDSREFDYDEYKIFGNFDNNILQVFDRLENSIKEVQDLCDALAQSDSDNILNQDLQKLFKLCHLDYSIINSIAYTDNPFIHRNWEIHSLAMQNHYSKIKMYLKQLKLKIIEHLVVNDLNNQELKRMLSIEGEKFHDLYGGLYYAD